MKLTCKSTRKYFHEGGLDDEELQKKINDLSAKGYEEIEWDNEKEGESTLKTFVLDAHIDECECIPSNSMQLALLFLERIGDLEKARKLFRNACKIYASD